MSTTYLEEDVEVEDIEGTPNLSQVLARAMRTHAKDFRVCLPGIVTAVGSGVVSVRPAIQATDSDDQDPIIENVRVLFPGSSAVRLLFEMNVGDTVLLLFCDRSIDEWDKEGGATAVQALDPRVHDITDAVAIPMSFSAGENVLGLISEFLAVMASEAASFCVTGASPGAVAPLHADTATAFSTLKTKIDGLIS